MPFHLRDIFNRKTMNQCFDHFNYSRLLGIGNSNYREFENIRKWDGGGMKVSCTLHFKGGNIYIATLIKRIKRQRLINQYMVKGG